MKYIANKRNLFLTLLAFLPVFTFPFRHSCSFYIPLLFMLIFAVIHWVYNTVIPEYTPSEESLESREKSFVSLVKFRQIFLFRNTSAGYLPTQNIKPINFFATPVIITWLSVFASYFITILAAREPVRREVGFYDFTAPYLPAVIGLVITALCDILLTHPGQKSNAAKSIIFTLAGIGIFMIWFSCLTA
ncbi:MAG: hypothetical protein IIW34_01645 [Clostridia bacterium]|nr:hypothetical protein [Clostridia bacterium]